MTSTLMIRADTTSAVLDLLKADKTVALATAIADDNARSEIEIYAAERVIDGERYFDTRAAADQADAVTHLANIQRALDYINVRGDVFEWQMKRRIDAGHLVQFVDKYEVQA